MSQTLSFQRMILKLLDFWADHGCLIWQPYNVQVGAGTMNPATVLRVLGPEPWNVAYIEPSVRPDDGRFGDNPNRMQLHYQLQVILQPDPGNPQELYLQSLEAIGVDPRKHDIRFVEDNWESPALGAWGLGWEVWLDGQEITQFTYFQQAGGFDLDPVAVELTYGLERILIALQGRASVWELDWGAGISYGDVLLQSEIEHCKYYFNVADVDGLRQIYDRYEAEARRALEAGLVIPAHDYNLKCSHLFNVLDTRGAIGVTERATYFHRMREMTRQIAGAYVEQRQRMEYPFLELWTDRGAKTRAERPAASFPHIAAPFLLEIGTEELPAGDLDSALEQLNLAVPQLLEQARLAHQGIKVLGTPRRLAVWVRDLAPMQSDLVEEVKGPPADRAFDAEGQPTPAALGFARRYHVPVEALQIQEQGDRRYVVAQVRQPGKPAAQVLPELLPTLIDQIRFVKSMRWQAGSPVTFSRPIRWLVALLDDQVVPFEYAGLLSGRISHGLRPENSPEIEIGRAGDYMVHMNAAGIVVQPELRSACIREGVDRLAAEKGGQPAYLPGLLEEVTHLVEKPTPLIGTFDPSFLSLPREVLVTVMRKHQRYFPVMKAGSRELMPLFIAVRNGGREYLDLVREGNEHVIRARFADAQFFFQKDSSKTLESFLPKLDSLTFETQLGSMLDKTRRLEKLAPVVGEMLGLDQNEMAILARSATLSKADLATSMVVEMTSLQGTMGEEYARRSGELDPVARAIGEHYLPRSRGDALPQTRPGLALGLADRLDSLMGLFAVGLAPTGSADPYGLRRAALGMVQALIAVEHPFGLTAGLQAAADLLPVQVTEEMIAETYEFVLGRLRVLLREEGFRYDVVEAVLAERGNDPAAAYQAVNQLSAWVAREDWEELLHAYGRCKRMARRYDQLYALDLEALVEPSAQELARSYLGVAAQVTPGSSVDAFMTAAGRLIAPINQFFDRVLVDDDEHPALRDNRRALVQHIAELADGILDFSKLEGF